MTNHPMVPTTKAVPDVIPPFDLVQKWMHELMFSGIPHPDHGKMDAQPHWLELVEKVSQYASDQELKACVDIVQYETDWDTAEKLHSARRPKPPSLADEALDALEKIDAFAIDQMSAYTIHDELTVHKDTICRALQQLKQLQGEIK